MMRITSSTRWCSHRPKPQQQMSVRGGGVKVIKHHQASAEIPSFALNIEGSRYGAATDFFPSLLGWATMVAVKVGSVGMAGTKSHRETAHKASHVNMGNTK